ncbi:conserved hypothetical protein [Candidatus Sulfopaludibacter sp. SbA4]|nr:conserved hypothetical protein [Candidatus Sulfopaludibacter sp. SbA4]
MGVLKPRTRIVTFRLAEEEFERIKNLCVAEGARSMSDYARTSLCNSISARAASSDTGLDARVGTLDRKVQELDRAVKELTQLIEEGFDARPRKKTASAS